MTPITDAAIRGHRATGAIFFSVFGGMWLAGWASRSGQSAGVFVLIAIVALALTGLAVATRRRHAAAMAAVTMTPERRRAVRIFHVTNVGQWVVMIVLGNVLANMGLGTWIMPMIIAVVGLHFFPIAWAFHNQPHYVTGVAMLAVAIIYPHVAAQGPADPVGAMGAGLLLWVSAAWALRSPGMAAQKSPNVTAV